MIENKKSFKALNQNSNDAEIKELIYKINKNKIIEFNKNLFKDEYLCICSGGTTSSCAKNNQITVDLRKNYNQISYDKNTGVAKIGGGVLMGDLLNYLEKFNRMFPIGLSKLPGIGYILTGGISPLSKRYGLAIDNLKNVKGFFGNGDFFSLDIDNLNKKEISIWEGIKGAAPFFSIITEVAIQTFENFPIQVFDGFVEEDELKELIAISETFPRNFSFQFIFSDTIYVYIVEELKTEEEKNLAQKYASIFQRFPSLKNKIYRNLNQINFFPKELNMFELNANFHSEVISLLGKSLKGYESEFVEELIEINAAKPNKACYVAIQQLGDQSMYENKYSSYFIHREACWKPWIFASWEKINNHDKKVVINWMNESWNRLRRFFPYIHLAQLHNHLNSHQDELKLAFGSKLGELKDLKRIYDPSNILPPL